MAGHLFHRLLAGSLLIAAAFLPAAVDSQDTGPCGEPVPCTPGEKLGDPASCEGFYKCDASGTRFVRKTCSEGQQFDSKKQRCKDPLTSSKKIVCREPCPNLAVRDTGVEEEPAVPLPDGGLQPSLQQNETHEALTTSRVPDPLTEAELHAGLPDEDLSATPTTTTPTTTTTTAAATTTTVETTKMETTQQQTTTSSTVAPPVVILPSKTPEPPYVVLTEGPQHDVTDSGQEGGLDDVTGSADVDAAGVNMTIIIGAVIGGVVVIVLVIIVLILLLRRRKQKKDRDITRLENPQYATASNAKYRFSRDSTLFVGPTVNLRQTNNNTPADTSGMDSVERKKRPAPAAPSPTKASKDKAGKRKAPPPPNPFTGEVEGYKRPVTDLYEKDSQGSDENLEMSTFTAKNDGVSPEPVVTDPLLDKDTSGGVLGNGQADIKHGDDDDDDVIASDGDEYDETKNPFAD